jgi:hypothetical protein
VSDGRNWSLSIAFLLAGAGWTLVVALLLVAHPVDHPLFWVGVVIAGLGAIGVYYFRPNARQARRQKLADKGEVLAEELLHFAAERRRFDPSYQIGGRFVNGREITEEELNARFVQETRDAERYRNETSIQYQQRFVGRILDFLDHSKAEGFSTGLDHNNNWSMRRDAFEHARRSLPNGGQSAFHSAFGRSDSSGAALERIAGRQAQRVL